MSDLTECDVCGDAPYEHYHPETWEEVEEVLANGSAVVVDDEWDFIVEVRKRDDFGSMSGENRLIFYVTRNAVPRDEWFNIRYIAGWQNEAKRFGGNVHRVRILGVRPASTAEVNEAIASIMSSY